MNQVKVLVVDSDESSTNDIEKYFSNHDKIKVVAHRHNGDEALEYIINNVNEIDVIVMDLIIPKSDGMFILSELERRNIDKKIIITTSFKDDDIMDEANKYGIDYYMLKPLNYMSLESRILSAYLKNDKKNKLYMEESVITDILHQLGIPSHIRGYQFIREGILIVYKHSNKLSYITKEVYPEIAMKYNTTPSRVERAIRHAIEISWSRGDINKMEEIFGNSIDINRDKPTNSEYLATIADRLKVNRNLIYN